MKLILHCAIFYLLAYAYGINGDDKEHSSILINSETEDLERQLFSIKKRAGARAFGSTRTNNFENFFFPSNKRHQTFSPYYYYQQPKRGGGHPFYAYWSPSNAGDVKFVEGSPFYRKRTLPRDSDDYIY